MKLFSDYDAFVKAIEDYTGFKTFQDRTEEGDTVTIPYIICLNDGSDDFYADNKNFVRKDDVEIILHTYHGARNSALTIRKDSKKKLEEFLEDCGMPFSITPSYIVDIQEYTDQYSVQVMYEGQS